MHKTKQEVIDVFDDIAAKRSWEELYSGKLDRVSYNFMARQRAVEELLEPYTNGRALDIGCGSGDLCGFYFQKGVRYTGMDLSSKMIERANANYRSFVESGKVDFQVGDCESLPFETGEADVLSAVALIEYLPDPTRALDEIARVTKSGGYAVVTVPHLYCIDNVFRFIFKPIVTLLFPLYQKIRFRPLTVMSSVKHYKFSQPDLDQRMGERGFEKIEDRYTNFHAIPHPIDHLMPSIYIKLSEALDRGGKGRFFKIWASNYIALYRKN